jgi:MFS family permease
MLVVTIVPLGETEFQKRLHLEGVTRNSKRGLPDLRSLLRALTNGPEHSASVLASVTAMNVVTISPVFFAGAFGAQISADLGIGPAALGGLASVFFAVTGLSATHLGRLADRIGGRSAGRAAVVASVSSLAIAGVGNSYIHLLGAMAVGGIGNGLGGPTANMIVSSRMPPEMMGAAFGIKQSAVPLATFLGGMAIPIFVIGFGWRPVMVGAAILSCLTLLAMPTAHPAQQSEITEGTRRPGLSGVTIATGAAFLFGIAAATSMSTLLSTFSVQAGLTASFAGYALSAGSVGAIVVRVGSGIATDRNKADPTRLSVAMMTIGATGFIALSTGTAFAVAGGTFVAYAIGWGWSGLLVLNLIRAHPTAPGSATGVVLAGAAIGGMVGPASIGWIAERFGFSHAWLVAAGTLLVAAVSAHASGVLTARDLAIESA